MSNSNNILHKILEGLILKGSKERAGVVAEALRFLPVRKIYIYVYKAKLNFFCLLVFDTGLEFNYY